MDYRAGLTLLGPMAAGMGFATSCRAVDWWTGTSLGPRTASLADAVSLKLLLPTFVLSAFLSSEIGLGPQVNVMLGLGVPLVCLAVALLASRQMPRLVPIETALASSTFGAGNRGMLMLVVLFADGADALTYVTHFSFLDVGHAIFIIGLIPLILPGIFGRKASIPGATSMVRVLDNYLVVTLLWVGIVMLAIHASLVSTQTIRMWLDETGEWRKQLFTVVLFLSIFIKTRLHADPRALLWAAIIFAGLRGFLLILFVPLVHLLSDNPALTIAMIVYILAPPASMLPALVARSAASRKIVDGVTERTILLNMVFVLCLLAIVAGKAGMSAWR